MRTTDDLIAALGATPPKRHVAPTGAIVATAFAAAAVTVILALTLLGPRADLVRALEGLNGIVVFRLALAAVTIAAGLSLVRDLSVPGRHIIWWPAMAAAFLATLAAVGAREFGTVVTDNLSFATEHDALTDCLWKIPALALPASVALVICVRYLAPTNLALAGALIGLAAGGIGAVGYSLHCHDDSVIFILATYILAISETVLIGALAGPFVLRWR